MDLNTTQQIAARFPNTHLLVLAGAGTGKTRTIIARAHYLLDNGVPGDRLLILTFTRRAANEIKDRLRALSRGENSDVIAGTFHYFCLRMMRAKPRSFGMIGTSILDRDDQLQLMRIARGRILEERTPFPSAGKLVDLFSYCRNINRPFRQHLEQYNDFDSSTLETILACFKEYLDLKLSGRYLDFDDILFYFARRLHESNFIRNWLKESFDHILVDEMQDTNPVQWLILDGLRDPATLFCVGDDAQSIYGFRGADFRNVHSFTDRVPHSSVVTLTENYRSTQEVLDVSNWLLSTSPLSYDRELKAHRGTGVRPRIIDFQTDRMEGDWIADDITTRFNNGSKWRDHMVLTRTARAARFVEASFREKRIPYIFVGGRMFSQLARVKDYLALFRCVNNLSDNLAWIRFLTLFPRIGDVTGTRLTEEIRRFDEVQTAIDFLEDAQPENPGIVRCLSGVLEHSHEPIRIFDHIRPILDPIQSGKYTDWEGRKQDLDIFKRISEGYTSILTLLESFTLDPIEESYKLSSGSDDDFVLLTTIHGAKGTEAEACYVIRVQPFMYPHSRSLDCEDLIEEDRRILYVALTRAKDLLIITRSQEQSDGRYGYMTTAQGAAYFLEEIPSHLHEYTSYLRSEEKELPKSSFENSQTDDVNLFGSLDDIIQNYRNDSNSKD